MSATTADIPSFEDIVMTMELLPDLDERYQFLIDLGRKLPALDDSERIEDNRVHGCQSSVWLLSSSTGSEVEFRGESDAAIVTGLVAVLLSLYNNRSAEAILSTDATSELARLNLEDYLSPNRRNGLSKMVERIRSDAFGYAS
ncbi:MAG: SufE family protein [Verrucomicrobiota bacterium]